MNEGFWVEVMAPGKWTDAHGREVEFTAADLDGIAAAHEANYPEVEPTLRLGDHPGLEPGIKPAVGFVKAMKVEGGKLLALFVDVPEIVLKAFEARRYKKVSAGLWQNWRHKGQSFPWFLNHVAILGAELPAISGLADLQTYMKGGFGAAVPEAVFCFTNGPKEAQTMTDLETKLTADLAAANEKAAAQATAIVNLTAERDTATAANKALTKQIAEFTNKAMEAEVTAVVDAAIADGRLLPKDKDKAVKTGLALRNAAGVEFKAGDGSPFDGWKDLLASGGKVVDLSEKGAATGADAKGVDAEYELGRKAALKIEGRSDAD